MTMKPFSKILIANRGENGLRAVSAKPNCAVRAAHQGDHDPIGSSHV